MKERPIIFSAPMVRAILDGRKTQTRRIVKQQPEVTSATDAAWRDASSDLWRNARQYARDCSPFGNPGDVLWVRETWADTNGENGPMISYRAGGDRFLVDESYPVDYSLYPNCQFSMWCGDLRRGSEGHAWRSPIHMPKWASRIRLKVKSVRVERLQDITEEDAVAEGIERPETLKASDVDVWEGAEKRLFDALNQPVDQFRRLWESIHGPGSWDANPWVWVYEWEPIR